MGGCLEDERFNPQNGNAEQRTGGGLLVWRKADNWTAFTDGAITWISGPAGLVSRSNAAPLFPYLNGLLRLWKAEGRDGIRRALQRNSAYREQCDL